MKCSFVVYKATTKAVRAAMEQAGVPMTECKVRPRRVLRLTRCVFAADGVIAALSSRHTPLASPFETIRERETREALGHSSVSINMFNCIQGEQDAETSGCQSSSIIGL